MLCFGIYELVSCACLTLTNPTFVPVKWGFLYLVIYLLNFLLNLASALASDGRYSWYIIPTGVTSADFAAYCSLGSTILTTFLEAYDSHQKVDSSVSVQTTQSAINSVIFSKGSQEAWESIQSVLASLSGSTTVIGAVAKDGKCPAAVTILSSVTAAGHLLAFVHDFIVGYASVHVKIV